MFFRLANSTDWVTLICPINIFPAAYCGHKAIEYNPFYGRDNMDVELESSLVVGRTYTYEDQIAFAKISGDYNPIHVDPILARRLLFGEMVVHGIHNVVWTLSILAQKIPYPVKLTSLKARFVKPITLGKTIYLKISKLTENSADCRIYVTQDCSGNAQCMFSVFFERYQGVYQHQATKVDFPTKSTEVLKTCIEGRSGRLEINFDSYELERLYPKILKSFDPKQLGLILASTRLVGMECPGLHSLYVGIHMDFCLEKQNVLEGHVTYNVTSVNTQINAMTMDMLSVDTMTTIQCLLRPNVTAQTGIRELQERIESRVFQGQRALIIGGSRGLGELTAKILACGGADKIILTYHSGQADVLRVANEIATLNKNVASYQYNVLSDEMTPHDGDIFSNITHCYYYASAKILPNNALAIDKNLLDSYMNLYLYGLEKVIQKLLTYSKHNIKLFNPSTVFIENLESNFAEYVIAKNAVELYGQYLERMYSNIRFVNIRFPKMKTDQTSSIIPEELEEPANLLCHYLVSN